MADYEVIGFRFIRGNSRFSTADEIVFKEVGGKEMVSIPHGSIPALSKDMDIGDIVEIVVVKNGIKIM